MRRYTIKKPFTASVFVFSLISALSLSVTQSAQAIENTLPLNEVRTFVDIFDRIKKAYVEEVDDKTLLENAIKGMLSELDPHSAYLDPKAFNDLQINTTGEFGGLGIEVGMENNFIKVITPIDDTPAEKAGVLTGDLIIKLDDEQVNGMTLEQAVSMMRGKPGTAITLTVVRDGETQPLEIPVVRAVIQVKSVRSRLLEPAYGYVRLSQFQVHTADELREQLKKIHTPEAPLKGLVLDMRNNPGGVLQAAVAVCDTFLNEGLVTYTKGRLPNSELRFSASKGDLINGIPIIVLINGGSASASEIVAGALQDHGRAIIMGTTSFGKGSVQTVLPLHNDRALKLTTARYYTPKGRSIQATGIIPDITVETATITRVDTSSDRFREADLRGHLSNQFSDEERKGDISAKETPSLAEKDYQLFQALSLLKGLKAISSI
ncbi:MAG: S41 family peptidase [Gammaproteobacteria bacterium]